MRRESHKTEAQSLALAAVLLAVAPSFSLAWAQHPSSRSTPSRTPSSAPHAQSQPHGNSSAGFSHPGSQLGRGPGGAPEHSPAQPSLATPFGNGAGRGPFVGGQPGPGAQPGAPRTGDHGPGAVSTQPWGGQPQSYRTPTESSTLGAWMEQHRNMPVHEQERQLKADPSFNRLNSGTQQRLLQQLHQMNAMSPEQQQRRAARVESGCRSTCRRSVGQRFPMTGSRWFGTLFTIWARYRPISARRF